MLATLESQVFPKENADSENGFYILRFYCNEHMSDCALAVDNDGQDLYQQIFTAKGTNIPRSKSFQYELEGHWEKNKKMPGKTFVIESFQVSMNKQDKATIITFLSECFSGKNVGIGPKTISRIYDTFKEDTIDVFEKTPERLLEIKGMSKEKYEQAILLFNANLGAKDVLMNLSPLGVSADTSMKIYEVLKGNAKDVILNHPWELCKFRGISFKTADAIAIRNNLNLLCSERAEAAIVEVLKQAEFGGPLFPLNSGHLCVKYGELLQKTSILLENKVTIQQIQIACSEAVRKKAIVYARDPYSKVNETFVYRKVVSDVENELAMTIAKISKIKTGSSINFDEEIRLMERIERVSLAPEQRNAVEVGLSNQFAVITGGPGTGKTTIIKFIRNIYQKNNKGKKILMCSPTGVAATRMSESTGGEACTVHKALNLIANEDGFYNDVEELDYDLIIVDETSMLDIYLAKVLVKALKRGAKMLFIGDVEQLPSVGPGAVLRDIIMSKVVPVAELKKVYRQADGSLIALNALLIKNGKCCFDYGEAFQFIPANSFEEASRIMTDLYLKEISIRGIQDVMMLSPFRQKTATGVNELNKLRDFANPPSENKKEIDGGKGKIFREGDKVIQLKNVDAISNGDVGIITKISDEAVLDDEGHQVIENEKPKYEKKVTIDFGNDRIVSYDKEDLQMIDWSYAMTVHKSQGSEAHTVIFNLLDSHGIMLKRNLLYTAVTRAKKKVIIIGQMSAIEKAVVSGVSEEDRRTTLLSSKIRYFMEAA